MSDSAASAPQEENEEESLTPPSPRAEILEGQLSPRHRRFAQLLALQCVDLKEMSAQTGYTYNTCKALAKDPHILKEVYRLQDKVFEENIKDGLKSMKQGALDHLRFIMTDDTGRVKSAEKTAVSQWLIEKLDGKATQTHDVGENTLAMFLDQLDARKTAPQKNNVIDVTPDAAQLNEAKPKTEEELLTEWVSSHFGSG